MAYEGAFASRAESFSPSLVPNNYKWAWDGLVAAIPGWEGSGTGPIDLVAGLVGTFVGTAGFSQGPQSPELNFAASTYVSFGDATQFVVPLYGDITIAVMHSPGSTAQTGIWVYSDLDSGHAPFALIYSLGSNSQYAFWNDNAIHGPVSTTTFAPGTRNFVIGRRIGDHAALPTMHLFVNGSLLGTTTSTVLDAAWNMGNTSTNLQCINRFGGYNGYMGVGTIGNILLWNRALSDAEIETLHNDPYGPIRQQRRMWVFPSAATVGIAKIAMASYRRRRA